METLPSESSWDVPAPESDSRRRGSEVTDSLRGAVHHYVSPSSTAMRGGNFLHCAFYLVSSESKTPSPLPGLVIPFSRDSNNIVRNHYVSLIGLAEKVLVAVSSHAGALPLDSLLSFARLIKAE